MPGDGQPRETQPWETLQESVRGANKKYSQDHHGVRFVADGAVVVLSVADGHGSSRHRRSDLGSRWAVEEFIRCATPFARRVADAESDDDPSRWPALAEAAGWLGRSVCARWRERARTHEANGPSDGVPLCGAAVGPSGLIPYGSTLLGAVVSRKLVFCWRLGDGDIVLVGESGAHHLFDDGEEQIGDDVDSLCGAEPWRQMRTHWQPLSPLGARKMVLLSTDGLSKSFAEADGYRLFAKDVYARAVQHDVAWVRSRLRTWLDRAAGYSGDDTTLVAAYAGDRDGLRER
jgi:hypothetical protein